jgi:hypothetical protein
MGDVPDVYQYDDIPQPLRVQIIHIMNDAMGDHRSSKTFEFFKLIYDILCREYGIFSLIDTYDLQNINYIESVRIFILQNEDINKILYAVELSFRVIDRLYRDSKNITSPKITPDEAIEELNFRFREHGVGYQYESGEILRVDSQIIHTEAVKPVLQLLSDPIFQGANEEFLKAHEHYRRGNYKECLNECLKAFESTMKIICNNQGWNFEPKYTAQKLINICFNNHLIPDYLETQFSTLRQNLESGIPTMRNKLGGHGQGSQSVNVPPYFAAYQLHLTASTILFLIEAEKSLS